VQTDAPIDWAEVAALYGKLAGLTGSPAYRRALELASADPERRYLERRLAEL
jgi:predicted RNA polymerase sigma factor